MKLNGIYEQLLSKAEKARNNAYAPYSDFCVGAALITQNGKIYTGCNVENAAYSLCLCAERTAIAKAISEGETKITALAVVGGKRGEETILCPPCGSCRQVMAEFAAKDFSLVLRENGGNIRLFTIDEILPLAFSL